MEISYVISSFLNCFFPPFSSFFVSRDLFLTQCKIQDVTWNPTTLYNFKKKKKDNGVTNGCVCVESGDRL